MSSSLLDEPVTEIEPTTAPTPSTLLSRSDEPSARACPVCGSGATYQTLEGRWGCTTCGATWA
ncbi:hypothetical protein AB0O91_24415 [Kitasatospora sp. NPDC089797]|uniref:hypothetical protein n=1 Tax=Kitasatospora sp. NPDC089797 TaxID=3155298 RepID=UPI003439A2C1